MMCKIWKYPRDMIPCIRSSYCIDNLVIIYLFLKKIHFKHNYAGTFDISCGMFTNVVISNVNSLVLTNNDMDSENVNLIRVLYQMVRKRRVQKYIIDRYIILYRISKSWGI